MFNLFLAHINNFQDICYRKQVGFLLTMKIFKDDVNLLANVTIQNSYTDEVQRGPEVCDVISAKRYSRLDSCAARFSKS